MNGIILGVFSSLVASIIWICFGYVSGSLSAKKRIALLLDLLYDSCDSFDSAMVSENEQLAESQADNIIKYSIEIFDSLKILTFLGKKRKLFLTVLCNLYYTTTYYKRIYVGYSEDEEQKAKLQKFKRKYYYIVKISDDHYTDDRSFLMLSVVLLQELIQQYGVKKALLNNLYVREDTDNKYEIYSNLLAPQNMKSKYLQKYDIRRSIFKMTEYKEYIRKKLRREGIINSGMDCKNSRDIKDTN